MTLPMGGVASGRRVDVLRHSHMGVGLSQHQSLLSARSFGQHCRSRRNRLVNQPVSAGPITADRSTSHKSSENHSTNTTQHHSNTGSTPNGASNGVPGSKKIGPPLNESVQAILLAGGPSTNALARFRAMPAVKLGSNMQLIDVPISNCIKSGVNKMYVLTQFNSHTLNTHIAASYPPVVFGGPQKRGFVDVLTASQTPKSANWYKGSADAVRQQLDSILDAFRGMDLPDELLILSGQALYRMDYADLLQTHRSNNADITIATHAVGLGQASFRGCCKVEPDTGRISLFYEKPTGDDLDKVRSVSRNATEENPFEASMGIYVFKRDVLVNLLRTESGDTKSAHFGADVIPHALESKLKVVAHHFDGYWRDISNLRDFFEVNLEMTSPSSPISVFDVEETIVSRGHILPPAMIHKCEIVHSLMGEGSALRGSYIKGSVIGCNTFVANGCHIEDSLLMGNDNYSNDRERERARQQGLSVLGIGENSVIKRAIIDDNVSIGSNVQIINKDGIEEADHTKKGYVIQNGIVVILKGAIIPDGTVI
ncbi:TPA: hypothetical protein ACH3X3_005650 [Trebouxia sp. C0006]